jgi:predicted TIM-barrel fold metal-dependent hydrolase
MVMNDEWLNLQPEGAIETDLPVLDPHHHLWNRPESRYTLEELVADTSAHRVRQTVFVECTAMYRTTGPEELRCIGETEYVQGVAAEAASRGAGAMQANAAIVGTADLRLGERVDAILEAQLAASPNRFRGVRHRAAWPMSRPPARGQPGQVPHLLLDSAFRAGFSRLRLYALSFEVWLFFPDLPDVADLATAFPDTTIILNHLGAPILSGEYGTRDEVFANWRRDITAVAACPNVVLKVGGIQMPVNGFGWHEGARPPSSEELLEVNRPWYEHAIEQFGPARSMFESNFPVDRASCSYTVLWNQFKKLSKGFRADERVAMLHDTAARVYRLPLANELPEGDGS